MVGVCISLLFSHALADFGDVTDQHILYCRILAESFQATFHFVSCCLELIFPGIFVFTGHIVSRMIARYDHKRCEDHFFCSLFFDQTNDIFQRRVTFYGSQMDVVMSQVFETVIQCRVDIISIMAGSVSHKDQATV